MKEKRRKVLVTVLGMAMVLSLLQGCGDTQTSPQKETGEQTSDPVQEESAAEPEESVETQEESAKEQDASAAPAPALPLAEPVTIDVMALADASVSVDYGNMAFWKMVEEETGVKVNWTVAKGDEFTQKKNLMFASGEYPDVIFGGGISTKEEESYGVEQQILIPLDEYVNEAWMPNYYGLLESRPNFQKQMVATDGHIYSISRAWEIGYNSGGHFFINKQWLDNLGLEVPKTVEELMEVLRAFKENDPNGNGQADEIPLELVLKDDASCAVTNLFGLFGQLDVPGHLVLDKDQVVFSAAQDGYRTALEWIHEAYADGLIDAESFSQDMSTYYAKIKGGNVGCFIGWRLEAMAFSFEGMEDQFVCMDPPRAEGADPVWYKTEAAAMIGGAAITTANEHVEETIAWLDYLMNPDIAFQARQGILGVYQEMSDDGKFVVKTSEDGSQFYTNEEINADCPGPGGLFFLTSDVIKEKYTFSSFHLEKYPYCEQYEPYLCEQSPDLISRGRLSQEDRDTSSRLKTDIDKFVDENTIRFISEGVTDSTWDNYLETLQSIGLEEYVSLSQKSYDAFNKN